MILQNKQFSSDIFTHSLNWLEYRTCRHRRDDSFNISTDRAQLRFDFFITAIDVINAIDQRLVTFAINPASTSDADARKSDAITRAPFSDVGPSTIAVRPSIFIRAPMR